ncbi:MAG: type II secretion system inner membrane protein GspF [Pseudomonadales bacterium]|nr:type II secretion system inner membrane protein GspF [Pseudomonadales bacterium]
MPVFEYQALNEQGRQKKGVLEGDSARQIRQQLRDKNWTPLSIEMASEKEARQSLSRFFNNPSISAADLSLVTRQLATLIQAGLAVDESLRAVSKQSEKSSIKSMILAVRAKVLEGYSLADSLTEYPRSFPDIYRSTVAAGEKSGHLDLVLEQLADYTERRHETQQKIKMAMLYPLILMSVAVLIIVGMLTYVVPKMVSVFENRDQALPFLTQALIDSSDFLQSNGIWLVLLAVMIGFIYQRAMKQDALRQRAHRFYLRVPLLSKMLKGADTARLASTLSILFRSGVPLVEALSIAGAVTSNMCIRAAVADAAEKVREGGSLHRSLDASGLFPPMLIQMIASGEASGELDNMLQRSAQNQQRELEGLLNTLVGLFEPIILLIMGGVVLLMVLAIMLPIISLNNLVG